MLVLSRKNGERIHIGDDIFIEVRRVAGSRVTLAVNAPRDLRVLRGELLEAAKSFDESDAQSPNKATDHSGKPPTSSETIIVTQEALRPSESLPGSSATL